MQTISTSKLWYLSKYTLFPQLPIIITVMLFVEILVSGQYFSTQALHIPLNLHVFCTLYNETPPWLRIWVMSPFVFVLEWSSLISSEDLVWAFWVVACLDAWMYLIMLQNAPQGWSREQGHCLLFFFLPLFASGTQLPHLTFSIWPLPRGEIARVSKGGRHTSWILLSFNLHSPFSPWWCTWIRNEDIAQLRGFLRLLLRYCSYFCAMPRFWCIMDMDIGFITFVWCFDISIAQKRNSSAPATGIFET